MATRTTVKSGLWSDPTVWGTGVPLNADTVNINHDVVFDVDMSDMAAGVVNITIASGKTLSIKPDSITYLKWSGQITGSGNLMVGTPETPIERIPEGSSSPLSTLHYTGAVTSESASMGGSVNCHIYGWIPETPNHTFIEGNHEVGSTQIQLKDHIDIQNGEQIIVGQGSAPDNTIQDAIKGLYTVTNYDQELKIATITPPLQADRIDDDAVAIFTRSVKFLSTNKPSTCFIGFLRHCEGALFQKYMALQFSNTLPYLPNKYNTYTDATPVFYCQDFRGEIQNTTVYSTSSGTQFIKNSGVRIKIKECALINCNVIINTAANVEIKDSVIQNVGNGSSYGFYCSAGCKSWNCKFKNISNIGIFAMNIDIYDSEFDNVKGAWHAKSSPPERVESFNHNKILGNYWASMRSGKIETQFKNGKIQTGKLIFKLESLDYPVFRDYPIIFPANKSIKHTITVNKDFDGGQVKLQIIDPANDPLIDQSAIPLAESIFPNIKDTELPLSLSYKSNIAKQLILRIMVQNTGGNILIDTRNIEKQYTDEENRVTTFKSKLVSEDNTFRTKAYGETICIQLLKQKNTPLDLTGTESTMTLKQKTETREFSLSVENAENGVVSYTWQKDDLKDLSGWVFLLISTDTGDKLLITDNLLKLNILN